MVGNSGSLAAPGHSLKPRVQDRFGGRHERRASLFAAFADGVHVGADGEGHVLAGESGELGDPQSGLDGEREHGVIASSGPGGQVAGVQQRVDLGVGEVGDEVAFGSFGWDGEHALDGAGVFGVVQREVAEQGVDGGQAVVAGGGAVVAVAFEVIQERGDQRRVELGDVQGGGRVAEAFRGEGQQEPEGEFVGADGVRAGGPLADQPVGEEGLQRGGERGHRRPPYRVCSRSAASPISSGDADRYQ